MKRHDPIISVQLAAGSVASPFYLDAVIRQELCHEACASAAPLFAPTFSVVGTEEVGTDQHLIKLHVEGVINYTPCRGGACSVRTMTVSEDFTVPYSGTAAPASVTVSTGETENSIETSPCRTCGRTMVSRTPISLTVTATT